MAWRSDFVSMTISDRDRPLVGQVPDLPSGSPRSPVGQVPDLSPHKISRRPPVTSIFKKLTPTKRNICRSSSITPPLQSGLGRSFRSTLDGTAWLRIPWDFESAGAGRSRILMEPRPPGAVTSHVAPLHLPTPRLWGSASVNSGRLPHFRHRTFDA